MCCGDDGRARHEVVLVVLLLADGGAHLCAHVLGLEAELLGHEVDGLGVEPLVDRHHDADAHAGADDLVDRHVHHGGQLAHGDELGELERLAACLLFEPLLVEAFLHGVALLAAVLGSFLVLVLAREACQGLLYLACHVLLAHFHGLVYGAVLAFLALAWGGLLLWGLLRGLPAFLLLAAPVLALACGGLDVNALLAYAHAFLALASLVLCGGLFLALLAPLFLRLFLWAGALVDGVEVDLAYHVELRRQPLLGLQGEYLWLPACLGLGLRLSLRLRLWLGRLWLGGRFLCRLGLLRLWLCRLLWLLRLHGLWLGGLRLCCGLPAHAAEVYLAQRLEFLPLPEQVLGLGGLLLGFLLLCLLREDFLGLVLYVLVALEGAHQCLVLFVGDLGVDVGVVLDLAEALLVLEELYSRLQAYVQFCQYFV